MNLKRHIRWVPLYNIDRQTGARVEIFYADRALAASFGWLWRRCQPGFLPGGRADWPICQRYAPYRNSPTHTRLYRASRRLLMPGERAARPRGFFAPELSIIVHDFTHQVLDQLLSHPAVLLAS